MEITTITPATQAYMSKSYYLLKPIIRVWKRLVGEKEFDEKFSAARFKYIAVFDNADRIEWEPGNIYLFGPRSKEFDDFISFGKNANFVKKSYLVNNGVGYQVVVIKTPDAYIEDYMNFIKGKYSRMYINNLHMRDDIEPKYRTLVMKSSINVNNFGTSISILRKRLKKYMNIDISTDEILNDIDKYELDIPPLIEEETVNVKSESIFVISIPEIKEYINSSNNKSKTIKL